MVVQRDTPIVEDRKIFAQAWLYLAEQDPACAPPIADPKLSHLLGPIAALQQLGTARELEETISNFKSAQEKLIETVCPPRNEIEGHRTKPDDPLVPGYSQHAYRLLSRAADLEKRLRQAEETLYANGYKFDENSRKAKALLIPETGNRPKEFITELMEALYEERQPTYQLETGDTSQNPKALQLKIAGQLELYFEPELASESVVKSAINNLLSKREQ
jgi:hypothetical protein